MATLILVLLIVGVLCFVAAAVNVTAGRVNLVALGLACWLLTVLLPRL